MFLVFTTYNCALTNLTMTSKYLFKGQATGKGVPAKTAARAVSMA